MTIENCKIDCLTQIEQSKFIKYDVKDDILPRLEKGWTELKINKLKSDVNREKISKFIEDYQNLEEKNHMKKYFLYRDYPYSVYDCDCHLRTCHILKETLPWLKDKEVMIENNAQERYQFVNLVDQNYYRGDTMNSFKTTYNQTCSKGYLTKEILELLTEFATLTHTIGNFIPLPIVKIAEKNLNSARGFSGHTLGKSIRDYWDLTLVMFYDYFTYNESSKLDVINLFEVEDQEGKSIAKWLENYGEGQAGWDKFIEENSLGMYVTRRNNFSDKNRLYGKPILFWKGHSFENPLPKSSEDVLSFLKLIVGNSDKDGGVKGFIEIRGQELERRYKESVKY